MKILETLEDAVLDNFKAHSTLKMIEDKLIKSIEYQLNRQYRLFPFLRRDKGFNYTVVGCKAYLSHSQNDFKVNGVKVEVGFACVSKMSTYRREKVDMAIEMWKTNGHMPWCSLKDTLWGSMDYYIGIEQALLSEFNLNIK